MPILSYFVVVGSIVLALILWAGSVMVPQPERYNASYTELVKPIKPSVPREEPYVRPAAADDVAPPHVAAKEAFAQAEPAPAVTAAPRKKVVHTETPARETPVQKILRPPRAYNEVW